MFGLPWWASFLLGIALKYGAKFLENKYPQFKDLIEKILAWIQQSKNPQAVLDGLHAHVDEQMRCNGVACPPHLVGRD